VADVTRDYSASVLQPATTLSDAALRARLAPLTARAARELAGEGFARARTVLERQIDVRYIGQSYEITLPFAPGYRDEFHRRHERTYGYSDPARPVEVVAVRVRAAGLTDKPTLPFKKARGSSRPRPAAVRPGRFDGRVRQVAFYRWPDLIPGATAAGPAVVTSAEATAVIPPGFRFRIDGFGNVVVQPT